MSKMPMLYAAFLSYLCRGHLFERIESCSFTQKRCFGDFGLQEISIFLTPQNGSRMYENCIYRTSFYRTWNVVQHRKGFHLRKHNPFVHLFWGVSRVVHPPWVLFWSFFWNSGMWYWILMQTSCSTNGTLRRCTNPTRALYSHEWVSRPLTW